MEHNLKGKSILFFYLSTFNYENEIKWAMEREGAMVDAYNERPSNKIITRVFLKLNRKLISKQIEHYYDSIIEETKTKKYDYIFFIKGESISRSILKKLRAIHPESKIMIYLWDSEIFNKNAFTMLDAFDQAYSFDRVDCETHQELEFLPLFYVPQFAAIAENKVTPVYKMMFVGTVHNQRYEFVSEIVRQIENTGGKCFTWFYFPSKLSFYKLKWDNKKFRTAKMEDFKFTPLSRTEILSKYAQSIAQIDLHDPLQTGLTMRTIETLGAKRKLITTNKDVVNYDFYRKENILVVEKDNPIVTDEFINRPWAEIPDDIYKKYSISSWLNIIFR